MCSCRNEMQVKMIGFASRYRRTEEGEWLESEERGVAGRFVVTDGGSKEGYFGHFEKTWGENCRRQSTWPERT